MDQSVSTLPGTLSLLRTAVLFFPTPLEAPFRAVCQPIGSHHRRYSWGTPWRGAWRFSRRRSGSAGCEASARFTNLILFGIDLDRIARSLVYLICSGFTVAIVFLATNPPAFGFLSEDGPMLAGITTLAGTAYLEAGNAKLLDFCLIASSPAACRSRRVRYCGRPKRTRMSYYRVWTSGRS